MAPFRRLRRLVLNLVRSSRTDRELDTELQAYLELLVEEKVRGGVPPAAARREARLEMGGMEQVKEEVRRIRAGALVEQLVRDLQYALRGLRRSPGFAVAIVVTLALGIGANTAVFSVVDAMLFRPLPVTEPGRVVALYRGASGTAAAFSYPEFQTLAAQRQALAGLSAWSTHSTWARVGADLERMTLHVVSPDYFEVLGVRVRIGAGFPTTSDTASASALVISDALWRSRFAADPGAIGRSISVDGRVMTIVGVAPEGFTGLAPAAPGDGWITFASLRMLEPDWQFDAPKEIWLRLTGRLRDGVTARAAEAILQGATAERIAVVPAAAPVHDPEARAGTLRLAWLVGGVAAFVLLIACANVASLMLVRATARSREIGVRLAIGASRGRIARQMIAEIGLLAGLGGAAGIAAGYWMMQALLAFAPASAIPRGITISLDIRVVLFAFMLAAVTALLFGTVPAWQAARLDVLPVIKGRQPPERRLRAGMLELRRGLVIVQIALSGTLLVGAGLFVRTLAAALNVAPGYDVDRLSLTTIDFGAARLAAPESRAVGERLLERVRSLPGVEAAALGSIVPFSGAFIQRPAVPDGVAANEPNDFFVPYSVVSPGFFRTMGMPQQGRDFDERDSGEAPRVVIVNETLARRYWPDRPAIGQRVTLPLRERGPLYEVIGVVADSKYVSLTEPQHPFMYLPWAQALRPRMTLHVRTARAAGVAAIREAVRASHPDLPVSDPIRLSTYVDRSIAPARTVMRLLTIFGAIALLISAVGVYGLTAYSITQRTKELGVRMALGASPLRLVRMLVSQSGVLILIGLSLGLTAALLLGRFVRTWLFGVTSSDPTTFAAAAVVLGLTTVAATLLPARRASRIDPLVALRDD